MLGGLIEQNLAADPSRRRLLHPSVVTIDADDAGVDITLRIDRDAIVVAEGSDPAAQVRIHADSGRLLSVVATPLRWGLPDPFSHAGRSLIAAIARGPCPDPRPGSPSPPGHPPDEAPQRARGVPVTSTPRPVRPDEAAWVQRREHAWLPAFAVLAVIVLTTVGGFVVAAALAQPAGPPVGFPGLVEVQPLSGWEPADPGSVDGRPFVQLTRGNGTLARAGLGRLAGRCRRARPRRRRRSPDAVVHAS